MITRVNSGRDEVELWSAKYWDDRMMPSRPLFVATVRKRRLFFPSERISIIGKGFLFLCGYLLKGISYKRKGGRTIDAESSSLNLSPGLTQRSRDMAPPLSFSSATTSVQSFVFFLLL